MSDGQVALIAKWRTPSTANADSADEASYYNGVDAGCNACADDLATLLALSAGQASGRTPGEAEKLMERFDDVMMAHDSNGAFSDAECERRVDEFRAALAAQAGRTPQKENER